MIAGELFREKYRKFKRRSFSFGIYRFIKFYCAKLNKLFESSKMNSFILMVEMSIVEKNNKIKELEEKIEEIQDRLDIFNTNTEIV